jgi:L-fuculose-phosphate aldolase
VRSQRRWPNHPGATPRGEARTTVADARNGVAPKRVNSVDHVRVAHARERDAIAAAARRLARDGLVLGTAGNLSLRAGEHVVVTPTGAVLSELEAEQVAVVDRSGTFLDGPLAPTSELGLHLALYERRGAGAVVHTHSPMATALSCLDGLDEVPVVHYAMLELGGSVPVARYATFGTAELADRVLAALADRRATLMANHGAVCFAGDLQAAVELGLLLEWSCGVYWRARALGTPRVLEEAQLEDVREAIVQRRYGTTRPA